MKMITIDIARNFLMNTNREYSVEEMVNINDFYQSMLPSQEEYAALSDALTIIRSKNPDYKLSYSDVSIKFKEGHLLAAREAVVNIMNACAMIVEFRMGIPFSECTTNEAYEPVKVLKNYWDRTYERFFNINKCYKKDSQKN